MPDTTIARAPNHGATAVITHRIRPGMEAAYEAHVDEIKPVAASAPGYLDLQWIRPVPGLTDIYTIILRFDTEEHLKAWMGSAARTRWIERAAPLFAAGDDFFLTSGLDFWFAPKGATRIPARWKQFLISWSAIFPLVLGMTFVVKWMLGILNIPKNLLLTNLAVTGLVVFLMIYAVMPRYTKLVKRWLSS